MIGGIDTRIAANIGVDSLRLAARSIRARWPDAIFENGLTGEPYGQFDEIPFEEMTELFIYRDRASADVWSREGAVPAALNTMIHLLVSQDELTVVVDEKNAEMEKMIEAIRSALGERPRGASLPPLQIDPINGASSGQTSAKSPHFPP